MNNFFLLNEAITVSDFETFKNGMSELLSIERANEDEFLKHDSIWSLEIITNLYSSFGQEEQVICQFIEQISAITNYVSSEIDFDILYPNDANAFLGIDFSTLEIPTLKQIIDSSTFEIFKSHNLSRIDFRSFWEKRKQLFPNLELCGEVKAQISRIGNSPIFNQIIERLKELDEAVKIWQNGTGDFSYKTINREYALRISPETEQTMARYGNERIFSLPNHSRQKFELHIKTGDLRFHFYPDNLNRKLYVGYIGKHLNTISG